MELVKSDLAVIRKSPAWAIDSWGLGKSELFLLMGCLFLLVLFIGIYYSVVH